MFLHRPDKSQWHWYLALQIPYTGPARCSSKSLLELEISQSVA